jgi:hypothetical protein
MVRFVSKKGSQAVVSNSGGCRLGLELERAGLAIFFGTTFGTDRRGFIPRELDTEKKLRMVGGCAKAVSYRSCGQCGQGVTSSYAPASAWPPCGSPA